MCKRIMMFAILAVVVFSGCAVFEPEVVDLPIQVIVVAKWIDMPYYWVHFHPVNGGQDRAYAMDPVSWTNATIGATNTFNGW